MLIISKRRWGGIPSTSDFDSVKKRLKHVHIKITDYIISVLTHQVI